MKALVLSGDAGTRLRPNTHTSAKQLVPVANKAVLSPGLESIAAAGVTGVAVTVGDTAAEIRGVIGDGPEFALDEHGHVTVSYEFSIVPRASSMRSVARVESSLVGRRVEVTPAPGVPSARRLVLGDHS